MRIVEFPSIQLNAVCFCGVCPSLGAVIINEAFPVYNQVLLVYIQWLIMFISSGLCDIDIVGQI